MRTPADADDRPSTFLDRMVTYLVDTPARSVGVVDGWETDAAGLPVALVVGRGWSRRRRLRVPVEAIAEVVHRSRRIVVADHAVPPTRRGMLDVLGGVGRRGDGRRSARRSPGASDARPVVCAVGEAGETTGRDAAVVSVAAGLARRLGAPLVLAPIGPRQATEPGEVSATAPAAEPSAADEGAGVTADDAVAVTMLSALVAGADVRRSAPHGTPAADLAAAADEEGAQLLVVGAPATDEGHDERTEPPWLDGARSARCPVVVVPA